MGYILLWLIIAILVIVVDLLTSTFLFIWFSAGSLAAIIANLLGFDFVVQFVLFVVVSVIAISLGYPWLKRKYKRDIKHTPLMEETYIGKIGQATEDIHEEGRIKVDGIYWGAINKGEAIKKDERYKITGLEGNKLIIQKFEEVK